MNFIGQEFQGDQAAELRVFALIDHSHPASSKRFKDAVMRDSPANHWREFYVDETLRSTKAAGWSVQWLRLSGRSRGRLESGLRIPPRGNVRHGGHVRNLATRGFGDIDAGMIEQQACGAIEFDARLLVRGLCGNQIRLRGG